MADPPCLSEAEDVFGFGYPRAFVSAMDELGELIRDSVTAARLPGATLLLAVAGIADAYKDGVPVDLIPFLRVEEPGHTDYYCLRPGVDERDCLVVVFAVHAVVYEWEGFEAFLSWLRQRTR